MIRFIQSLVCNLRRDEDGAILILAAVLLPVIVGIAALAMDMSVMVAAQRQLQASTDAAALAAADSITGTNTAAAVKAVATSYSAASGNKNAQSGLLSATMASGYPQIQCLTSTGHTCAGAEGGNAVIVQQNATVPLYLAPALGIASAQVTATAMAAKGGIFPPLDVMMIIDTTASMGSPDPNCSITGSTRLTCAMAGAKSLLGQLWPSVDHVGLMVFPGIQNSKSTQIQYEYCNPKGTVNSISTYNASPAALYQVIGNQYIGTGLVSNYKTSNTSALDPTSDLVIALGGDGKSGNAHCAGLQNPGGVATYYAEVITAAQTALVNNGRANVQKVIIFLSDGAANASQANVGGAAKYPNQCHQGITAAANAAAAGTWVYSIAYGGTSTKTDCSTDTGASAISPCSAMKQIASDSTKFYADKGSTGADCSSVNSINDLVSIFQNIGNSLTVTRLVPLNAT